MPPWCILRGIAFLLAITLAGAVCGAPGAYQDIRAMGMGGAGVAAARPSAASIFNPALLAQEPQHEQDSWGLTLPGLNGRLADRNNVPGQVGKIQDAINRILHSFLSATVNSPATRQDAGWLADRLEALDGETLRADVAINAALTRPDPQLGLGFFASGRIRGTAEGNIRQGDIQLLRSIENFNPLGAFTSSDLGSSAHILATGVAEAGVSLARQFPLGSQRLSLGLSPKIMQLHTFDYYEQLIDFNQSDFNASDHATSHLGVNLDAGAALFFGDTQQWRLATSVRNLFPMDLAAKTYPVDSPFYQPQPAQLKIRPQIALGLSYEGHRYTLTADLDLSENSPFGPEAATRWLSLGGEYRLNNQVALRTGIRQNRAENTGTPGIRETTEYSLGLGLNPGRLRLELATVLSKDAIGAGVELSLRF